MFRMEPEWKCADSKWINQTERVSLKEVSRSLNTVAVNQYFQWQVGLIPDVACALLFVQA